MAFIIHPSFLSNITIDFIEDPVFKKNDISISVLRLDKIHPLLSGNKWFKLRFYLEAAAELPGSKVVTFGGAWSNHLLATAVACTMAHLPCAGIIRGEKGQTTSFPLQQAREWGMELHFVSREAFDQRWIPPALRQAPIYVIDQGGYGPMGAAGAATICEHYDRRTFTHTCCAVGTGTMMAGLINGAGDQHSVIGIPVIKNDPSLEKNVMALVMNPRVPLTMVPHYHFGGYAKYDSALIEFMNAFYLYTKIPTDFVYTGKLLFGIHDLVRNHFFPPGSRILVIHSGGLSGNVSLPPGSLIF